jgi:hypothetical protein
MTDETVLGTPRADHSSAMSAVVDRVAFETQIAQRRTREKAYGRQEEWEDSPADRPQRRHASRTNGGSPDWPAVAPWPGGRPTSQWSRIDAGRSDQLVPDQPRTSEREQDVGTRD